MKNNMSPEDVGRMVASNLEAKRHGWKFFFCNKCKHYFSYDEMSKVDCFCCAQGICKGCSIK